ncbi:MAG: TRAP transporter substrate-binding protein [Treponema sp.]|nr:TRAP transporter substrate-binding protein [Treponema sp.]
MRKFLFAFFTSSFIFSFTFLSCSKEPTTLVMSEPNPDGSISTQVDLAFAQKVEELSNGSLRIQVVTGGALGDNTQVMKYITEEKPSVNIARVSPASLVSYKCKKSELLDIPFTFSSREHFYNFAASPVAQQILDEPYEIGLGVKGLFYAEEGFRHFFSTKKLESLEDLKDKKIRSAGNTIMTKIIESLGGKAVPVSFSTLYSALQTGQTEIAEQPIANYLSNNFYKVAPYMILDGHQLGIMEVVITADSWDNLSKKEQDILVEAGKYASEYCKQISQEAEEKAKKALEAEGVEFTEIESIVPWQNACADVINDAVSQNTELYGEIITIAD